MIAEKIFVGHFEHGTIGSLKVGVFEQGMRIKPEIEGIGTEQIMVKKTDQQIYGSEDNEEYDQYYFRIISHR